MAATVKQIAPPPAHGVPWLAALAAALVAAALAALLWGAAGPFPVRVDGVERTVDPGATLADLAARGYFTAHAGDLIGVDGKVARVGGADIPSYVRNGRSASESDRVFPGDVLTSSDGADAREPVISVRVSIDPTATIEGSGPILTVVRPGRPGIEIIRKGEVTGQVVWTKVLTPAVNIVLAASHPRSTDKLVALTFDDGPWPVTTLAIVNILKQEGVPGTFFEIGEQVRRTPSISRAVAAAGEVIGNHSWSHPWLTKLKPAAVRKQITDTAAAIQAATGTAPTLLRPPYGAINHEVWAQARASHEQVVLWNVDTLDWSRPGVPRIMKNLTSEIGQASIVLMHDGGGDRSQTIAALPLAISWLKAHGYTFLTVPQMEQIR